MASKNNPLADRGRAYNYDPIGNRKTANEAANNLTYTANSLNQYESISGGANPETPAYDADGNMTVAKDMILSYNAENRLIESAPQNPQQGSIKSTYIYDYMGRRARKTLYTYSSGSWQKQKDISFIYDGWNMVKEIEKASDSSPEVPIYYVWGLDLSQSMQGAGGAGGLIASVKSGNEYLYSYDGNGNVGQMVKSADGTIAARYEYDPFGKTIFSEGPLASENPYRFSTKYLDGETGLYYYGFRFYDVKLGRWINRDPAGTKGGHNLYSFVINSPFEFVDRLGLLLVGVDGTDSIGWMKGRPKKWNSFVRNFFDNYKLQNKESKMYHSGPSSHYTGSDNPEIENRVWKFVTDELCKNQCQRVNLIGHSRGGYIVMELARRLKGGFSCPGRSRINQQQVDFLGLYEAVDMAPGHGEAETIPSNVNYAAHAINGSGSRFIFNKADDGPDSWETTYFREEFNTTHSGVGGDPGGGDDWWIPWMSSKEERLEADRADAWMLKHAKNNNIEFGSGIGLRASSTNITKGEESIAYYEIVRCGE